jgi:hypothetical protein
MTGKEIRDLGYIKWKNDMAWMETMKGKRWDAMVKYEKSQYNTLSHQPYVEKVTRQMEEELKDTQQYLDTEPFKINGGTIDICVKSPSVFTWKWTWPKSKGIEAHDIDTRGAIVWYIASINKSDVNEIICCDIHGNKIWTKKDVHFQIAIIGNICYYTKETTLNNKKVYFLCVCDAKTGKQEHILFTERNPERSILLYKLANRSLYLQSLDPSKSELYRIKDLKVIPLYKNSTFQQPLGESIENDNCVLTRMSIDAKWVAHGEPVSKWILPTQEIQWINIHLGQIITNYEGSQTIWYCASRKRPKALFNVKVGSIKANSITEWENGLQQSFIIKCPYTPPFVIHIINNKVMCNESFKAPPIDRPIRFPLLDIHKYYTKSSDGIYIPYITIKRKGSTPKAQLIYVYGAYGSMTPIDWIYYPWYPLIKRNWAITFALVRGGGDIDASWADMARRENRHISVDDFEAVIRASQHKLKLTPDRTVIYGRSAGGVPVGAIVARYPYGELVGTAFTEVPYVDVLRTSSNPLLPLTVGEYKEFGNPKERLVNFSELLSVSPINSLSERGAPGVFVISRVGMKDTQVLAYESFKWINKLRGQNGTPNGKYVTIEMNEGHQHSFKDFPKLRAIDLAILDSKIDGKLNI